MQAPSPVSSPSKQPLEPHPPGGHGPLPIEVVTQESVCFGSDGGVRAAPRAQPGTAPGKSVTRTLLGFVFLSDRAAEPCPRGPGWPPPVTCFRALHVLLVRRPRGDGRWLCRCRSPAACLTRVRIRSASCCSLGRGASALPLPPSVLRRGRPVERGHVGGRRRVFASSRRRPEQVLCRGQNAVCVSACACVPAPRVRSPSK